MVVVGVLIALEGGDVRSRPRPCSFTVSLEITGMTRRVGRFSYRIILEGHKNYGYKAKNLHHSPWDDDKDGDGIQ